MKAPALLLWGRTLWNMPPMAMTNDHELHKGTGLIATNAINAESRLAKCTSKTCLFGYETWLTAVNMQDPELSTQRRMWIALAAAIEGVYPKKDVWSNHAINLGAITSRGPI
ncbi:hypothetical protein LEN26_007989 [Aphanomyces euteiches]|nr:hypothetical protein LEN26_007989 [Aphanomyces euteiches]